MAGWPRGAPGGRNHVGERSLVGRPLRRRLALDAEVHEVKDTRGRRSARSGRETSALLGNRLGRTTIHSRTLDSWRPRRRREVHAALAGLRRAGRGRGVMSGPAHSVRLAQCRWPEPWTGSRCPPLSSQPGTSSRPRPTRRRPRPQARRAGDRQGAGGQRAAGAGGADSPGARRSRSCRRAASPGTLAIAAAWRGRGPGACCPARWTPEQLAATSRRPAWRRDVAGELGGARRGPAADWAARSARPGPDPESRRESRAKVHPPPPDANVATRGKPRRQLFIGC